MISQSTAKKKKKKKKERKKKKKKKRGLQKEKKGAQIQVINHNSFFKSKGLFSRTALLLLYGRQKKGV
jgi:hypothetical protein